MVNICIKFYVLYSLATKTKMGYRGVPGSRVLKVIENDILP